VRARHRDGAADPRQRQGGRRIDPVPVISLGGTDTRLWRYKDIPAIVYGPSPSGMGSTDEHVTVDEFFHVVKCHVLSAYDYLSRPANRFTLSRHPGAGRDPFFSDTGSG